MDSISADASLETLNDAFHREYARSRAESLSVPILILQTSELIVHRGGQRHCFPLRCAGFDLAKTVAHVAVTLFVLARERRGQPTQAQESALSEVSRRTRAVLATIRDPLGALEREAIELLRTCAEYARRLSHEARAADDAEEFAAHTGKRILFLTELATAQQIDALHASVEAVISGFSEVERRELEVVVAGDHQARARSFGMQYFQRRLGEAEGSDERVTYGENLKDEQEALKLVATRRLDRKIARAFFGDDKRLQRDVLGDAAKVCLDRMSLEIIE
ncbi:MAG: hypothetical protein ACOY0T_34100 [Myxococcota bacterium]